MTFGSARTWAGVPAEIVSKVQAVQDDLAAGKITGIPDTVK